MTDQQSSDAMSCCIGDAYIHSPNMDRIAADGMRFTRAYTANPLCIPARTSIFTGRYSHETGIQTNTGEKIDPEQFPCMARIFKEAGYDTGFFGKWHLPFKEANKDEHGFDTYVGKPCIYDGSPAAKFIETPRDRPWLAVASFMNPHNICEWSRGQKLPGGSVGEPPAPQNCPPEKPNLSPPANETDIIAHMRKAYQGHRLFPVGDFTREKWRQYLWAYYRLVEKVDANVGTVLDALARSNQEENTVVIFLADHGECCGAHGWNQKTVFYDEASRVPFMIRWKGKTPQGTCETLVQTGVDVIPTLCDFAGIDIPKGLPGTSLRNHALGRSTSAHRPFIVSSDHLVQCVAVDGVMLQPEGRMVRSNRYKYCLYSLGNHRESLVDMEKDPGEMVNLAGDEKSHTVLLEHRNYLHQFAVEHNDRTALKMLRGLEA